MESCTLASVRFLGAVLLACSAASSQSFSVSALGSPQPRVSATDGVHVSSQTLPVGAITTTQTISVSAQSIFLDRAFATLIADPNPVEVRLSAEVSRSGVAQVVTATSFAEGAFDVDLSGHSRGSLMIGFDGWGDAAPAAVVDVHADGAPELQFGPAGQRETGTLAVPVTGAGPVRTRVTFRVSSAAQQRSALAFVKLSIRFVPGDTVAFRDGEVGCAPNRTVPDLSGQTTPLPLGHRLDFRLDNAFPNGFAMLVFGTETLWTTRIQLPPRCPLLVEPVAWLALPTDAAGSARFRFDLLRTFPPATLYLQALPFEFTPQVISSNRLDVVLVP